MKSNSFCWDTCSKGVGLIVRYISKLVPLSEDSPLFISGGGDTSLFVWNSTTGQLIQNLDLLKATGVEKPEVGCLEIHKSILAVQLQKYTIQLMIDSVVLSFSTYLIMQILYLIELLN